MREPLSYAWDLCTVVRLFEFADDQFPFHAHSRSTSPVSWPYWSLICLKWSMSK